MIVGEIGIAKRLKNMLEKEIAKKIINAFKEKNKLFVCGNGGSAAQAQHLAGELICKYRINRKPLPAINLAADTSVLTAIANDFGFENVFSRQLTALGGKGDILLSLSTTYSSLNVLEAERVAGELGMEVFRLPLDGQTTPEIQEYHLKCLHKICHYIDKAILSKEL